MLQDDRFDPEFLAGKYADHIRRHSDKNWLIIAFRLLIPSAFILILFLSNSCFILASCAVPKSETIGFEEFRDFLLHFGPGEQCADKVRLFCFVCFLCSVEWPLVVKFSISLQAHAVITTEHGKPELVPWFRNLSRDEAIEAVKVQCNHAKHNPYAYTQKKVGDFVIRPSEVRCLFVSLHASVPLVFSLCIDSWHARITMIRQFSFFSCVFLCFTLHTGQGRARFDCQYCCWSAPSFRARCLLMCLCLGYRFIFPADEVQHHLFASPLCVSSRLFFSMRCCRARSRVSQNTQIAG